MRELDASARRKRPQRSVAALQERWAREVPKARAERASAVPTAARAVVLVGALTLRVSLCAGCGAVWCVWVLVARLRAAGLRPPPRAARGVGLR